MLKEEVNRMSDLHKENAQLREILSSRLPATGSTTIATPQCSSAQASDLAVELYNARMAKAELERELLTLRSSQPMPVQQEDHTKEVTLLRASLATLASALEQEKNKAVTAEAAKKAEEDKVNALKSRMDIARKAFMRTQNDSARKSSLSNDLEGPQRFQSTGSLLDPACVRRNSLIGIIPVGLGLGVDAPNANANLSVSPSSAKASPLQRRAHRQGSTSIAVVPEEINLAENDQLARLRALRLGVTTTKVQSRRGSLAPDADFGDNGDLTMAPEKKRIPSLALLHSAAGLEGDLANQSRPPSAPLRNKGRNDSVAIFADWNRRCSSGSTMSEKEVVIDTIEQEDLRTQLENLRAQLAESEEARIASELALKGMKDYITTSGTVVGDGSISLPPLSSENGTPNFAFPGAFPMTPEKRASMPRWSLSNRLGSLGGGGGHRRESSGPSNGPASPSPFAYNASPALTTYTQRRTSTASNYSTSSSTTFLDRPTPSAASQAIFGQFSFSALVTRSSSLALADISPTITEPHYDIFPIDPSPILNSDTRFSTSPSPSASSTSSTTGGNNEEGGGAPPSLTDSASSRSSSPTEPALGTPKNEPSSFDQSLVCHSQSPVTAGSVVNGIEMVTAPIDIVKAKTKSPNMTTTDPGFLHPSRVNTHYGVRI